MAEMSVLEESNAYGMHRSIICKSAEAGTLSYNVLPNGCSSIHPAQMDRVFPKNRPRVTKNRQHIQNELQETVAIMEREISVLNDKIAYLQATIRKLVDDREDFKTRLDISEQERRHSTRLLEYHQKPWFFRVFSKNIH